MYTYFPSIDMEATGRNIRALMNARNLVVEDLRRYFGFEAPQAIYKWLSGKSLPTVDNLYAMAVFMGVTIDEIIIPLKSPAATKEQQDDSCCSFVLLLQLCYFVADSSRKIIR